MISDIYELSPIQAGMLFHRVFAPDSRAYFDQFSCRLTGAVDAGLLRRAWQQLVDRHHVLRTSFHWEGLDKPVQVVHAQATLPWQELDWRDLPPDVQAARWDEYLDRDRAIGFEPDVVPLMRAAIVRLSETDYYFCWSHHHLLLDGWCLALVLTELFARYEALTEGRQLQLTPLRPYSEYIKWLRHCDADAIERYWRDALRGVSAATPLIASSAARDATRQTCADGIAERQLGAGLTETLRTVAARHRLTLNTVIQGAWAILLSRYSGSDDVVFGATVSGRPPEVPGIETMLGVFINTVPVRVQIDGAASAAAWLAQVQANHIERERFTAIPLADIQKLADVEPGLPLFESNVIVMNYRLDERLAGGAAGIEIRDLRIFDQTDIPLTLQVTPGRRMTLEIVYDSARFDPGAVMRMLGHLEHLLDQFAHHLDRPLAQFEIVTAAERAQLLDVFNATAAPLDPHKTAIDVWEDRVAATPDAVALECEDARLTFRGLDEWANRLACGLQQLAPADRLLGRDALVAIAFKRSERLVAAILAIWKCGAAYVPVDPDYPSERIHQVLDTASPRLVLRDAGTLDSGLELAFADRMRFVSIGDVESAAAGQPSIQRPTGSDLAYVIFTSGSTGQPKGAMVEHVGMLNHIFAKIEDCRLDVRSVVVQNASHCFDISVWQCFAAMLAGGRTIVYRDELVLDPQRFLDRVRADGVTLLEVVPSYLAALLDRLDDAQAFPDLQFLMVTGETIKPSLVVRWFARFPGIPMVNAYGPTEASDDITHAFMHQPPGTANVPVGRPIRNFHVYIVDEQMRLCPIGVAGELCVSGPGVGRGYLNDAARTAAVFSEDPFRIEPGVRMYRTGDVGWFTADGTILLAGRKDHQIKVRGYRIELGDIEAALTTLEAVRDAAVVDRRDRGADSSYLAAYVSLRDATTTADQILDALAGLLPDYMIPATCTVLDALPLTPNGKINRQALPAPDRDARPVDVNYAAPRTPAEQALAAIWADVLGVARPGIHDNFFAAGGDSILSMQMVSRAARAGFELTPRDVFQHQTIAELAAVARVPAVRAAVNRSGPAGPAPLTPAQRRFFADVTIDRHHYNQSILLEVPAAFDPEHAARALAAVVAHHDALRLRFEEVRGVWQQTVGAPDPLPLFANHDLSSLSRDERMRTVDSIGGELQTGLNFERGPLLQAAFFRSPAQEPGRLIIVVHHLAIDGVSWRILLEDLATAYASLAHGESVSLAPVGLSYLEWSAALEAAPGEPVTPTSPPVRTDVAFDAALNTVEASEEIEIALDEEVTRAFLTLTPQAFDAGITELLLAAVGLAHRDWSGAARVSVDLETHGRDRGLGDLTRTIGWFTSTEAVSFDVPDNGDVAVVIQAAADGRRLASVTPARPALLLNYHGHTDRSAHGDWRLSSDAHGPARSPRQQREYLLEINGLVAAGRLRLTIGYSRHLHRGDTIEQLAHHLENQILAIVELARGGHRSRRTPAHFPSARLGQAQIETLLGGVRDVEDIYELSPTQQGLLFHALLERTSDAYFNQFTCVLRGPLDVRAFEEAWARTVARHAALRTSFHWRNLEHPVQIVHGDAAIPWSVEDWSRLAVEDQDRMWAADADGDRRARFDVATAPLMRCTLRRVAATEYRFRWSQHHLLLDGWSSAIVLNDVLSAYDALVRGEPFGPPAPPAFRDHILWLRRQDHHAAERFWRADLEGFDSPTPLIVGLPEMTGHANPRRMAEAEASVSAVLSAGLKALAAAQRITLNTLMQGVWALLLARHSGEDDVIFGAIASGRGTTLDRSDEMVGVFINTVPVRARIEPEARIFDWLRGLQRRSADREMFSHSPLADVQRWSAVGGGTPLFDTIVIFENYPIAESLAGPGHAISIDRVQASEPNNYAMTLVVTPGDTLALKIMFDEGRFDRATIDRTLDHVMMLLSGLVAAPDSTVGALPVITGSERALIDSWNATEKALPAGTTVLSLIESRAAAAPDRIAICCEGERLTYGALNDRANRLARHLTASHRLEPEARAVVMLPRTLRLVETVLALWKCGAAYVPVDPDYPRERIDTIVTNARAAVVITDDLLQAVAVEDVAAPESPRDPAALAYVIYTSGSTGVPKGAMLEHAGFLNHVLSMVDDLALNPTSVVAQTASQCFDISMWQLFAALVAGGTTVMYPEAVVRRPEQLAARFERDGVSVAQFVPSYLNVFLDAQQAAGGAAADLSTLTRMITIGEALKPPTVARWFEMYPRIPLMNAYGPTEASDSVTHFEMRAPLGDAMVPIGRPIQNVAVHVTDRSMRLCPIGVKGEICVAGIAVGRGYLFDEPRTRDVFLRDPFGGDHRRLYRTGDVGCVGADGALRFFGRRDHQVKVRGHRIELGEIEACLAAIDGVRDAVVVTRAGMRGDDTLCAYVTGQAGRTLDEDTLRRMLFNRVPAHVVPDVIRVLPELPVMPNGKIDRRSLSARAVVRTPARHDAPETDTERALARIWSEVLDQEVAAVDQSFFDLGGHSLKAIQIVSRINRDCGVELAIADLFERGTVRTLAALIDQSSQVIGPSAALVSQPIQDDYATADVQNRIWLDSRTAEGSAAYHMAGVFQLTGNLDRAALGRAFETLVERHEALRTVFTVIKGSLRQRVISTATMPVWFRDSDWCDPSTALRASPSTALRASPSTALRAGPSTSLGAGATGAGDVDPAIQGRVKAPFDLARGPLFDVELIRLGDQEHLLIVRLHHIIGDAASIRIILQEALAFYAAFRQGASASPLPALPIQYKDYVAWQQRLTLEANNGTSRAYWHDVLKPPLPRTGFMADALPGESGTASGIVSTCELDEGMTLRLRALAADHHTTVFVVVVAAVYGLLHRYTQQDDLVIGSTVSRRDHPLLEAQIGCYIDTLVLRGQAAGRDRPADLIERTARVCRDALAHRDYPFASLLDDVQVDVPSGRPPLFDVLVDYAPGVGVIRAGDDVGLSIAERRSGTEAAHHDTMFLISDSDRGTTMSIQLVFDGRRFHAGTVEQARDRLLAILRWLTGGGDRTLSTVELLPQPTTPRPRLRINLNTR